MLLNCKWVLQNALLLKTVDIHKSWRGIRFWKKNTLKREVAFSNSRNIQALAYIIQVNWSKCFFYMSLCLLGRTWIQLDLGPVSRNYMRPVMTQYPWAMQSLQVGNGIEIKSDIWHWSWKSADREHTRHRLWHCQRLDELTESTIGMRHFIGNSEGPIELSLPLLPELALLSYFRTSSTVRSES